VADFAGVASAAAGDVPAAVAADDALAAVVAEGSVRHRLVAAKVCS
jgi:hypothetical protein